MGNGIKYSLDKKYYYKGEFVNSKKEGKGFEETDEYTYTGDFYGDTMHGEGKLFYKSFCDTYEGEFKKGLIEGFGVYTWKNKEIYKGEFVKGKLHGKGSYFWPSGREFYGTYKDNLKEGQGEFKWKKSGTVLKCMFLKGKPSGMGELINRKKNQVKILTIQEIKDVLKSEKRLNNELSFLEYVDSSVDCNDLHYDLCSEKSIKFNNSKSD